MKLYPERVNRAYDRLKEPKRFVVAMALISPAFVASTLPFWWNVAVLFYCGTLGLCRSAYLCDLKFVRSK